MRAALAARLRQLAEAVWDRWEMDEVRAFSRYDLAVLGLVGSLYDLADRVEGLR